MALIDCPECGRQVSDKASACPGCGHPIKAPPKDQGEREIVNPFTKRAPRVRTSEDSALTRNRGCGDIIIWPIAIIIAILVAGAFIS